MVNEVNKIIKNTLIGKGALTLPSLGTLRVTRKSAQLVGKGVSEPEYILVFSSSEDAISLVDAISNVANIPFVDAEDIYLRWLDKVRTDGRVVINGVGSICDKSFKAEDGITSQLNPNRGEVLTITCRKSSKRMLVIVVLLVVALLVSAGAYLYLSGHLTKDKAEAEVSKVATENVDLQDSSTPSVPAQLSTINVDEPFDAVETDDIYIDVESPEGGVAVDEDGQIDVIEPAIIGPWYEATDLKHYVVVGSYKRRSNANGAIADIEAKSGAQIKCQAIQRGKMYSVVIFGSSDITLCETFVREYKSQFPNAWIYSAE